MIDVTTEQDRERLRTIADVALRENALLRRRIATLVGRLEVRARYQGRCQLLSETCQRFGVNPRDFLREAVHRAKANPEDAYLPHAMLDDASDLN